LKRPSLGIHASRPTFILHSAAQMCFGRQQPIQNQKRIKSLRMMVWLHSLLKCAFKVKDQFKI
ncbi:hypothetical protein GBL97_20745, partial [Yersinia pseudotuberculosis]|nr:hypothetical protein [Yersinia pseudotuberculosis]MBO1591491.1 hypothetical protein [Yersinia pseudotuberculosis]MBO1604892.1 hypothetical protein [Yersinia pseudotuberculosis]